MVQTIDSGVASRISSDAPKRLPQLSMPRLFTRDLEEGLDAVFATVQWVSHDIEIKGSDGVIVFAQKGVQAPATWSPNAVKIVASKYFRGQTDALNRETSVRDVITRVVRRIVEWTDRGGYFANNVEALDAFRDELAFALLHQYVAFNSPVWFNLGWEGRAQQTSACFIANLDDSMESILDLYKTEGTLFKGGSGIGVNMSKLRSSKESLAAGGVSSGPVAFMRGLDASAGSIRSGGSTRRAAVIRELDVNHPDIMEFITCKADAERAAHALVDSEQFSGEFNVKGGAYDMIPFQNANHSVHVTDNFMHAVENDLPWELEAVTTGETVETLSAREIFSAMAKAAHFCGDPGIQFHDTMNAWHTSPSGGPIVSTNPCSEFVYINNSSCNLSCLNLMRFLGADGSFDHELFQHVVRTSITAQEALVSFSSYPTPAIEKNSHAYRPLGLGYTNLGALLMSLGLAYDSTAGRQLAGAITSLMSATAYQRSADIADVVGPFPAYVSHGEDKDSTHHVLHKHTSANYDLLASARGLPAELAEVAEYEWSTVAGRPVRNGQISNLMPAGTVSFMLDADTTGIEPMLGLTTYKKLVGGGNMKIVNSRVMQALLTLGYSGERLSLSREYIEARGDAAGEDSPIALEHWPVFDGALPSPLSGRSIQPMGHVNMMAAVQPFLSGAVSKTINMSHDATAEDIADVYMQAWKLGLKCIAIYRDGCKRSQPISTKDSTKVGRELLSSLQEVSDHYEGKIELKTSTLTLFAQPTRRRLPADRTAHTHKFSIAGHEGYITAGLYDDGTPGEIFVKMAKEGSTISGLMDTIATLTSLGLQYGVPVASLATKFEHVRFEPSGFTGNKQIPMAKSVVDYLFRWLGLRYGALEAKAEVDAKLSTLAQNGVVRSNQRESIYVLESFAPLCNVCGALTRRSGACYVCAECGTQGGCS